MSWSGMNNGFRRHIYMQRCQRWSETHRWMCRLRFYSLLPFFFVYADGNSLFLIFLQSSVDNGSPSFIKYLIVLILLRWKNVVRREAESNFYAPPTTKQSRQTVKTEKFHVCQWQSSIMSFSVQFLRCNFYSPVLSIIAYFYLLFYSIKILFSVYVSF